MRSALHIPATLVFSVMLLAMVTSSDVLCPVVKNRTASTIEVSAFRDPDDMSSVVFAGCSWRDATVLFSVSAPVRLRFDNVNATGCSFRVTGDPEHIRGSIIEIVGCRMVACSDLFVVNVSSITNVSLSVLKSELRGVSVLMFLADSIDNLRLFTSNCTIEAYQKNGPARAIVMTGLSSPALNVTNTLVVVNSSFIEAFGLHDIASVAIVSCSSTLPVQIGARNVSFFAYNSSIAAESQGTSCVASIGVASYSRWASEVVASNLVIFSEFVISHALGSLDAESTASFGIAATGNPSVVDISDVTIYGLHSNSSFGCRNSAASFAVSSQCNSFSAFCPMHVVHLTIFGENCHSTTTYHRRSALASFGVASSGNSNHRSTILINVTDSTIVGSSSTSIANGAADGVSSFGIAVYGGNGYSRIETKNFTIFGVGVESWCRSGGHPGASFAIAIVSWGTGVVDSTDLTIVADSCAVHAESGGYGAQSMGIVAADRKVGLSGFKLILCNSTVDSKFGAVGVTSSKSSFVCDAEQWILMDSKVVSLACLQLRPSNTSISMMKNFALNCDVAHIGWKVALGARYLAENVTVNGKPCNDECLSSTFPGLQNATEANFNGTCSAFYPSIADIVKPQLPSIERIVDKTVTKSCSTTTSLVTPWTRSESASASVQHLSTASGTATDSVLKASTRSQSLTALPRQSISTSNEVTTVPPNSSFPQKTAVPSHEGEKNRSSVNGVVAVLSLAIPSETAEAVATAGSIATASAGLATPTAATQYARVAAVIRAALCILSEDEDDPNFIEFPLQFRLGDGALPKYCGACASNVLLLLVCHAAQWALWKTVRKGEARKSVLRMVKAIGIGAALMSAYFLPNVAGAASILLFSRHRGGAELIVAIMGLCAWALLLAWPLWATLHLGSYVKWTAAATRGRIDVLYESYSDSSVFVEAFAKYFDDSREPCNMWCRLVFFEEVFSTSITAFVSGIRPSSDFCIIVLIVITVVSVVHLMYTAVVRPFNRKIATVFSIASATVVATICVIGIVVIYDVSKELWLAYPLLLQNSLFFLQALSEGMWAYVVTSRRTVKRRQAEALDLGGDVVDDFSVPMTKSNPLENAQMGSYRKLPM